MIECKLNVDRTSNCLLDKKLSAQALVDRKWILPAVISFDWQYYNNALDFIKYKKLNPDMKYVIRYSLCEWGESIDLYFGNLPLEVNTMDSLLKFLGIKGAK